MNTAHRASLEPNTATVTKFPVSLCSRTYTVWTSQKIVAELQKFPILLGKAIPVRVWTSPYGPRSLKIPEFLHNSQTSLTKLSAVHTGHHSCCELGIVPKNAIEIE